MYCLYEADDISHSNKPVLVGQFGESHTNWARVGKSKYDCAEHKE